MLTITIPTFNRHQVLRQTLRAVLPQLKPSERVLIIDNASEPPVQDAIQDLLDEFANADVQVHRNKVNVGANANLVRCYELAETAWIWTLGDDDVVKPNAMEIIRAAIAENGDATYINFYTQNANHPVRSSTLRSNGVTETLARADSLGAMMFISSCLWRTDAIRPHIVTGYRYAYSCAPHIAMLIASLGDRGGAVLSHQEIIDEMSVAEAAQQSNIVSPCGGIGTLLEVPMPKEAFNHFQRLLGEVSRKWLNPIALAAILVSQSHEPTCRKRLLFRQAGNRLFRHGSLETRLKSHIGFAALILPDISQHLLRIAQRLRGREDRMQILSRDVAARI